MPGFFTLIINKICLNTCTAFAWSSWNKSIRLCSGFLHGAVTMVFCMGRSPWFFAWGGHHGFLHGAVTMFFCMGRSPWFFCRKLHKNERNWTEEGAHILRAPRIPQCLLTLQLVFLLSVHRVIASVDCSNSSNVSSIALRGDTGLLRKTRMTHLFVYLSWERIVALDMDDSSVCLSQLGAVGLPVKGTVCRSVKRKSSWCRSHTHVSCYMREAFSEHATLIWDLTHRFEQLRHTYMCRRKTVHTREESRISQGRRQVNQPFFGQIFLKTAWY